MKTRLFPLQCLKETEIGVVPASSRCRGLRWARHKIAWAAQTKVGHGSHGPGRARPGVQHLCRLQLGGRFSYMGQVVAARGGGGGAWTGAVLRA